MRQKVAIEERKLKYIEVKTVQAKSMNYTRSGHN